jgi:hypothetical protein
VSEDSGSYRLPSHVYEPLKPDVNAMEVFLLILAVWSGVSSTIVGGENSAIDRLLGPTWAIIWASSLCAGGIIALIGIFWLGRSAVAVSLQEFGYSIFTIFSIARVIPLIGLERYTTAVSIAMFAVGAAARIVQLEIRMRRVSNSSSWWGRRTSR